MTLKSPNNPMQTLRLAINKSTVNRKFVESNQSFKTLNPQMVVSIKMYIIIGAYFHGHYSFLSFLCMCVCMCVHKYVYVQLFWGEEPEIKNQSVFSIILHLIICSRISHPTCNSVAWLDSWANELWGSNSRYHP